MGGIVGADKLQAVEVCDGYGIGVLENVVGTHEQFGQDFLNVMIGRVSEIYLHGRRY